MSTKRDVQYLLGYVGGGLLVLGLIPLGTSPSIAGL